MAEAKIYEVEEEEHPHFRSAWNGEMWCPFHIAAEIINCQLDISRGVAERTLRELCAKGDVRSIRSEEYDPDEDLGPGEPEFIRPGEWLGKELDLEAKYPQVVAVSQDDLLYWIDKQSNKRQQWRSNDVALAEFLALFSYGERQDRQLENTPIKERLSRKRSLVSKAINTLWPDGVPDTITNAVLVHSVGNWLTDYCKRQGAPKPEISGDTILRAAGRK